VSLPLSSSLKRIQMSSTASKSGFLQGLALLEHPSNNSHSVDNPTTITTAETSRKRQIEDVEDVEEPFRPSRLRQSLKTEADTVTRGLQEAFDEEDAGSFSDSQEGGISFRDSDTEFNGLGNDLEDRSRKNDIGDKVVPGPASNYDDHDRTSTSSALSGTAQTNSVRGQTVQDTDAKSASNGAARSLNGLHEADRLLFRMRTAGSTWLEIRQEWKLLTGQDIASMPLANRYSRLVANMQDHLENNDALLLAAVEEVRTNFKREQWQLVSEAMTRRGAAGSPKDLCRQKYKELVRVSPGSRTAKPSQREMTESSPSTQDTNEFTAATNPKHVESALENGIENNLSAGATVQAEGLEINREPSKLIEKHAPSQPDNTKPGSLLTNAIVVDDSDGRPIASSGLPKSLGAGCNNHELQVGLSRPATAPPKATGATITTSRIGSATNRGPARFASLHKSTVSDLFTKSKNTVNPSSNAMNMAQGFGNLVPDQACLSDRHLHYNSHQAPASTRQLMAKQQEPRQQNAPQQQYRPSELSPLPTSTGQQHSSPQVPRSSELPLSPNLLHNSTQNPHAALEGASQEGRSADPHSPLQSIEVPPQPEASVPTSVADAPVVDGQTQGKPETQISEQQLKEMLSHRIGNAASQSKPWDVIAQECGVTATRREILNAYEKARYSSILHTSTEDRISSNCVPLKESEKAKPSTYPSMPSSELSIDPRISVPAVASGEPARAPETPGPRNAPQIQETPPSRRKRGRPPKSSPGTPSTAATPPSKTQKRPNWPEARKQQQSLAMKQAWARRKAREASDVNVQPTVSTKPSTVTKTSSTSGSNATFAAQILAAAAARTSSTPTPAPQAEPANPAAAKADPLDDEPRDLLSGKTMFELHEDDMAPVPQTGQSKAIAAGADRQDDEPRDLLTGKTMFELSEEDVTLIPLAEQAAAVAARSQPQNDEPRDSLTGEKASTATAGSQQHDYRSRDSLTGESESAHHQNNAAPVQNPGPPKAKKFVRRSHFSFPS